eukprot:827172-Rhodomonas_salina.1
MQTFVSLQPSAQCTYTAQKERKSTRRALLRPIALPIFVVPSLRLVCWFSHPRPAVQFSTTRNSPKPNAPFLLGICADAVVPVYGVPRSFRATRVLLAHSERICNTLRGGKVSTCGNTPFVTEYAPKALGARAPTAGRLLLRSLVPVGELLVAGTRGNQNRDQTLFLKLPGYRDIP